jgi:isoleucyl-tRNA synthetase
LYANIDGFSFAEPEVPLADRPEIDRWILSLLQTLVQKVEKQMDSYDPTPATRAIQDFVGENLSNWYVRLCRRRFWKGEYSQDKISAYQTLYTCLETVSQLMSPFAPFYSEQLFRDLNLVGKRQSSSSVHLSNFPKVKAEWVNKDLELQMEYAQKISSLVLSIRKKENIKVRQPLQKILIPVLDQHMKDEITHVQDLILAEVNVKELEFIDAMAKSIKPNFKSLGKKVGPKMKQVAEMISAFAQNQIETLEQNGTIAIEVEGQKIEILIEDVEILSKEIPGYKVANEGRLTVALDITLSTSLIEEGIAREIVSKVQNLRKDSGLDLTDKISLKIVEVPYIKSAINQFKNYICSEILANDIERVSELAGETTILIDEVSVKVQIDKFN